MGSFTFDITTTANWHEEGNHIIEPGQVVFTCEFEAHHNAKVDEFAERLFEFWKQSQIMGNASHLNYERQMVTKI